MRHDIKHATKDTWCFVTEAGELEALILLKLGHSLISSRDIEFFISKNAAINRLDEISKGIKYNDDQREAAGL